MIDKEAMDREAVEAFEAYLNMPFLFDYIHALENVARAAREKDFDEGVLNKALDALPRWVLESEKA